MTAIEDVQTASPTLQEITDFLYLEARLADESDYDGWEALWTDDALYWVPAGSPDIDPLTTVSFIYDNRNRISTRLNQLRTGKRYAQSPISHLRRTVGNVEVLGIRENGDTEVAANFVLVESRSGAMHLWAGRTTYHVRLTPDGVRLAFKKVVLVNLDEPITTMGFLI